MKKLDFEKSIVNNVHEYLYIKNDKKIISIIDRYGCIKENNSYKVYYINEYKTNMILGVFNNEDVTYDYLYEIMYYRHLLEIDNILFEYFEKNNKKCRKIINNYLENDILFTDRFYSMIDYYKRTKVKKRNKYGRNS